MTSRVLITAFILLMGAIFAPGPAMAALSCTASVTAVAFGSITVRDGNADQTTGTVTFDCSGGTPAAAFSTCLNLGQGSGGASGGNSPRTMRRSDTTGLNYDLRAGSHSGSIWNDQTFNQTLDANGAANFQATIFAEINSSGYLVKGGSYSSVFSGSDSAFSYGEGSCGTTGTSASFTVSATVTPACTLSVSPMAFGSLENLDDAIDQTASIAVNCTNATTYSVKLGLGNGAGVADPTLRKMTLSGNTITYGLYQNGARTTPWGDTISNDFDSTGTGSAQSLTVYGRIAAQSLPPVGTYADTIVVTIEY